MCVEEFADRLTSLGLHCSADSLAWIFDYNFAAPLLDAIASRVTAEQNFLTDEELSAFHKLESDHRELHGDDLRQALKALVNDAPSDTSRNAGPTESTSLLRVFIEAEESVIRKLKTQRLALLDVSRSAAVIPQAFGAETKSFSNRSISGSLPTENDNSSILDAKDTELLKALIEKAGESAADSLHKTLDFTLVDSSCFQAYLLDVQEAMEKVDRALTTTDGTTTIGAHQNVDSDMREELNWLCQSVYDLRLQSTLEQVHENLALTLAEESDKCGRTSTREGERLLLGSDECDGVPRNYEERFADSLQKLRSAEQLSMSAWLGTNISLDLAKRELRARETQDRFSEEALRCIVRHKERTSMLQETVRVEAERIEQLLSSFKTTTDNVMPADCLPDTASGNVDDTLCWNESLAAADKLLSYLVQMPIEGQNITGAGRVAALVHLVDQATEAELEKVAFLPQNWHRTFLQPLRNAFGAVQKCTAPYVETDKGLEPSTHRDWPPLLPQADYLTEELAASARKIELLLLQRRELHDDTSASASSGTVPLRDLWMRFWTPPGAEDDLASLFQELQSRVGAVQVAQELE